jgi:hypothetical protein
LRLVFETTGTKHAFAIGYLPMTDSFTAWKTDARWELKALLCCCMMDIPKFYPIFVLYLHLIHDKTGNGFILTPYEALEWRNPHKKAFREMPDISALT